MGIDEKNIHGTVLQRVDGHTINLEVVEPPLTVPGFEMLMLWHERVHRDPAHQWLRGHIAKCLR